jgi:hypothetical protein
MVNCPIIITLALFVGGYFVFLRTEPFESEGKIALAGFFHLMVFFALLSLFITFCISPGFVDPGFNISEFPEDLKVSYIEDFSEIDFALCRVTFCKKCEIYRPPRCHHCNTCGKCVLRYEHHCPFVANCVGFRNQKPFILFLVYTSISLVLLTVFLVWKLLTEYSVLWLSLTLAVSAIFILETGFALSQIAMVAENVTSLEVSWSHRVFDTGSHLKNFEQVFGENIFQWFFPCFILKGGENFPVRIRLKSRGIHVIENQFLV